MKKLVDSMFDEHKVVESKPLPEEKPASKPSSETPTKKSNNTMIIVLLVLLILGLIGTMIYNHVKNSNKDESGK